MAIHANSEEQLIRDDASGGKTTTDENCKMIQNPKNEQKNPSKSDTVREHPLLRGRKRSGEARENEQLPMVEQQQQAQVREHVTGQEEQDPAASVSETVPEENISGVVVSQESAPSTSSGEKTTLKKPTTIEDIGATIASLETRVIQSTHRYARRKNCFLLLFLISLVVNIILTVMLLQKKTVLYSISIASCPPGWIGYGRRCYYFSDAEETWDFSQKNCTAFNASLTAVDFQGEMDFLLRYKGSANHWFGLRRADERRPWKWTNGSDFNNWFRVRANGPCAYLNDELPGSTWCDTLRNWICSKFLHSP